MMDHEVVTGYLHGHVAEPEPAGSEPPPSIRAAIEERLRTALQRPPCVVAYSGGRDSSLVLAVAVDIARREGLDLPIPVTRRFTDAPAAEESEWQDDLIRHVGLDDWVRLAIPSGDLDLVGPRSRGHLADHGVVWPPMIHADTPLLEVARGGSLVDGEGGDEVLGTAAHRIAPVESLVRSPRPLRRGRARRALVALAPGPVRSRRVERRWADAGLDWLRPGAFRELVLTPLAEEERRQPLSFAESVRRVPTRRTQIHMSANRRLQAIPFDVVVSSPLLDPIVVEAIARHGGRLGSGSRADVLRTVAGDLLPSALIDRRTKATFAEAYFGSHTKALAAAWSGEGVPHDLVDVDRLRTEWLGDRPAPMTWALVQAAWLGLR